MQYQLYERTDGRTDKLPGGLDVQAIYEGSVLQIMQATARSLPAILIEHGSKGYDMISIYHPVKPCVQLGEQVNKGQKIGTSNNDGILLLRMINGRNQIDESYTHIDRIARSIEPETIFFGDVGSSKSTGIEYKL